MSNWNEDNFLEGLMPELRQELAKENSCPDPATLCAVMDGEAGHWLRDEFVKHVARCSSCSDLDGRLRSFGTGDSPGPDGEWQRAEKRLDNWYDSSFGRSAADLQQASAARTSVRRWSFPRLISSWAMPWALGVVTTLAVVVGVRLTKVGPAIAPQTQITERGAIPQEPTTGPKPAETPIKKPKPEQSAALQPKPRVRHAEPPVVRVAPPKAESAIPPGEEARLTPPPVTPRVPNNGRGPNNARVPLAHDSCPTCSVRQRGPLEARPPSITNAEMASPPPAELPPSSPGDATAQAQAAPRAQVVPPAFVKLLLGTRVWIQMNSVNRRPDGSFTFRGSLLLRLGQAGVTPLVRGTEVNGSGTVSQGRTSISIAEFVVPGARYKLGGTPSAVNVQASGTGTTVSFDAGRVLEMFLAADSMYERLPEATGQSASQQ